MLANGLTTGGKVSYYRYIKKSTGVKAMNTRTEIYNALHKVLFGSQKYRDLQAVLKLARSKGYCVTVKLNAKREVLWAEAYKLYNRIEEMYEQDRQWKNEEQSRRQRYENWQQQQTNSNQIDHQHFLRMFQEKLGMNPDKKSLKQMFWQLAKVHHPDAGGKTADFQALQRAYEIMG